MNVAAFCAKPGASVSPPFESSQRELMSVASCAASETVVVFHRTNLSFHMPPTANTRITPIYDRTYMTKPQANFYISPLHPADEHHLIVIDGQRLPNWHLFAVKSLALPDSSSTVGNPPTPNHYLDISFNCRYCQAHPSRRRRRAGPRRLSKLEVTRG